MADQVSAGLQLILQETGNNNNNWGVILNQQLSKLEEAIVGRTTIVVTGGTKVLSDDEQRAHVIVVTGALNADAYIEVKPRHKSWIFLDATTGPYSVSVRTANNPPYMLPRNGHEYLWTDGASVFPVATGGRVPIGGMIQTFGKQNEFVPAGYVEPRGQALSRSQYRRLFDIYGVHYGAGDGSTTFNLPNVAGRYFRSRGDGITGEGYGHVFEDEIRSHTHTAWTDAQGAHGHNGSVWDAAAGNHAHTYLGPANNSAHPTGTGSNEPRNQNIARWTDPAGDHHHAHGISIDVQGSHAHNVGVNATGGAETRPRTMVTLCLVRFQ
jgi:microcystin-dependent protein